MRISNSRFATYLRCPHAHYLRYYEGLEPVGKKRPLSFGSDMHKLLQFRNDPKLLKKARLEIGDAYYGLSHNAQQALGGDDYILDLSVIFADYQELYANHIQPQQTELEFEITVDNYRGEPIVFNGLIDEIYRRRRSGQKYVIIGEHKTFGRRPDMNTLVMNPQKCLYAQAYKMQFGLLPREVIWDHIHSSPASPPTWLEKQGRFSQAATKKVTPQSYRRACDAMGITDPDILAQAKEYEQNIPEFFFKTRQDVIPHMVNQVWEDFLYVSRDIIRQGHKNTTRNLTRDCSWCDFRVLCNAELFGQNTSGIKKQFFTLREHKEDNDDTE